MKFSIKDFLSKCDQIRRKLRIWLHLLKKSLMENFSFCAVSIIKKYSEFLEIRLEYSYVYSHLWRNLRLQNNSVLFSM